MAKLKISIGTGSGGAAHVSESAASPYLAADGLINAGAFAKLATKIETSNKKVTAAAEGKRVKSAFPILYTPKKPVAYSASLEKKNDHKYKTLRGQPVKSRSSLPKPGVKTRFVQLLPSLLEGADKALVAEVKKAHSAAVSHNKKAVKVVDKVKNEKTKLRDAANKEFDKNVGELKGLLVDAGLKETSIVEAMGMMGKTVLVKLPSGGVVSIGKADLKRFNAARKVAAQAS